VRKAAAKKTAAKLPPKKVPKPPVKARAQGIKALTTKIGSFQRAISDRYRALE
jgi:hypothetical protein